MIVLSALLLALPLPQAEPPSRPEPPGVGRETAPPRVREFLRRHPRVQSFLRRHPRLRAEAVERFRERRAAPQLDRERGRMPELLRERRRQAGREWMRERMRGWLRDDWSGPRRGMDREELRRRLLERLRDAGARREAADAPEQPEATRRPAPRLRT
jgi:hypothetical protein